MSDETPPYGSRYEEGIAIRKQVLGAEHVERALEKVSEFARPMQELVTEYCWGTVWSRDGLSLRDRSLLNIAMLTILNRGHELGLHVRGAVNNGATKEELQEVIMQAAIYAGVPAALESFRIAESVLTELEDSGVDLV